MVVSTKRIRSALDSMDPKERTKLFDLQKKYISVEAKLMFERDRNTRFQLKTKLQELDKKRWELLHQCN